MTASSQQRLRRHGGSRLPVVIVALCALVLIVAGGLLAYRFLFHRSGEAAIQLIPSDAVTVVTLDLSPSPQQVPLFKRVYDAIQREHLDTSIDKAMANSITNAAVEKEVRPLLKNDFAFALLKPSTPGPGHDPMPVFFLAVNDPGQVTSILARYGQKSDENGLEYYQFPKDKSSAAVINEYLILSENAAALERIQDVETGKTPSVATLAAYQQARSVLPPDANLMVFVPPDGFKLLQQQTGMVRMTQLANTLPNAHWLTVGVTLRDQGLDAIYQVPLDPPASSPLAALGQVPAIDPVLLKHLPAGAYGVMAMSQPGKYWDWSIASAGQDPTVKKSIDDGVAAFERETGMSVPRDILPALSGHLALAVYPDAAGAGSIPDGLILIDDANGADPAALGARIRAYVERVSSGHGASGVHFVSIVRNGATIWSLDPATQDQLRHALNSASGSGGPPSGAGPSPFPGGAPTSSGPSPSPGVPPAPGSTGLPGATDAPAPPTVGVLTGGDNQFPNTSSSPNPGLNAPVSAPMNPAIADKSVVYAEIGNTILLATSQKMLDRALEAYHGGAALANDPAFTQMQSSVPKNAQSLMMVNTPAIMDAVRPALTNLMANNRSGMTSDDITRLFGVPGSGIVASSHFDGKVSTCTFFMPLDYERLIHVIAVSANQQSGPVSGGQGPGSVQ